MYIAQATNANLTITQQIGLMAIMLLTSKGAAGVAGGGFIALAATLTTVGTIPAAGIMLIFGIDKFMSECRALVNFIGNAVATLFVAKWDKGLDVDRVRKVLNKEDVPDLPDEIDATENPLSIESTKLVGAYTADFHHHRTRRTRVLGRRRRPGTRRGQEPRRLPPQPAPTDGQRRLVRMRPATGST